MLYLAQTDTTAGFLAQHQSTIAHAKNREAQKACVWTTARFAHLQGHVRVPQNLPRGCAEAKNAPM